MGFSTEAFYTAKFHVVKYPDEDSSRGTSR